jgi:ribosomal protein L11
LFHLVLFYFLAGSVNEEDVVDGAHHEREESDTNEFDEHVKDVLDVGKSLNITVSDCR